MKNMNSLLIILFLSLSIISCDKKDDTIKVSSCDQLVEMNVDNPNPPTDDLVIQSLEINENCLTINFQASGCDGNAWELKLIDSGEIMESDPVQRNLFLSLNNPEECEAFIAKEISFDLTPIQVDGGDVILNITNSEDSILYEY